MSRYRLLIKFGCDYKRWERDGNHHAPNGIHILESTDITVEDITLESFPKFVLRPQMCSRVTIRNVVINNSKKSKGTNGIVIDSSEDVVVSDCTIHTGDKEDTIVMKVCSLNVQ
jgi:polygalacturonase